MKAFMNLDVSEDLRNCQKFGRNTLPPMKMATWVLSSWKSWATLTK